MKKVIVMAAKKGAVYKTYIGMQGYAIGTIMPTKKKKGFNVNKYLNKIGGTK